MRMIIQSRLIVFLDYECGQQLQEHQKCCRQSGRNDRMPIKGIYDIHCHIVPGVDDGATDIRETVKLLRMEYEQGVRTVIATPHFRFQMFETPAEKVREQFRLVEKAASEISPDLHVYLGCEFHANMEMLPMLREQKVMTMAGSRYVLTEFSHNSEESYIRERLGALLSGGYKPIMAHIERYEATRNSLDFVEELADISALKGRKVSDFFNQKIIQNIINKGSVKEGLAFSFNTGNHFILLSKSRNTGHYFLVLHSSAKQYKDTYLGLYPKPHNWYSNLIKTYQEKGSDRYIHYLKDDEALRFISIARSLNEQNRDIHNWFASEIFGDIKPIQQKTYHHYGMPTDYSIAIGTYVVDERDVVPIFSREGYPIFLFRPSSNMWSIVLEGKTKYIIPHGWGQELRYDYFAKQIQKEDFKNGKLSIKNGKFVLSNSQHGYYEKKFDIDYSARFNKKQVGVRDLYKTDKFDGKNIFGDTPYIKGTIEEILDPVALFSSDTEGAVKYYVSGEEN